MSLDRKDIYIDLRKESSIDVGLFKYKTESIKIYDQNNQLNLTYPMVSVCSNGQKFYKYDVNKESVVLYYPKDLSCIGQIDLEKIEANIIVEKESISKGIKTLKIKEYNKVIYGEILDKNNKGITGTFLFNNQDVISSDGYFQLEIRDFKGILIINSNKYKKCLPESPVEYNSISEQLKLKIICQ